MSNEVLMSRKFGYLTVEVYQDTIQFSPRDKTLIASIPPGDIHKLIRLLEEADREINGEGDKGES